MNPDLIQKWSPLALVALVGAAALDISGRFAEVGPARFTLYQLLALAGAMLVAWLLLTRREAWPKTPMNLPLLAFLGTAALSVAFATDRLAALVQLASLSSSVILALIVAVLVRHPKQGALVAGGVLAIAAIFGALALLEWGGIFAVQREVFFTPGYGIRARVTFEDPNILASFLMSSLLLAVPLLFAAPVARGVRAAGWAASALALLGLVATFSRGGLGALVIGAACVLVLARASRRAKSILLVTLVVAIVLAGAAVFQRGWVEDNVLDLGGDYSTMNRVYMVQGALKMWADNPFGVGLDNYQLAYPPYRDPRAVEGNVESHTAYVTVLAEMGFLGLAAFLWLLWRLFVRTALPAARDARDPYVHALAVGAFAAAAGLAAQAFTYSIEASKFWWFAIGMGVAAWRMYAEGESAVT